MKFSESWLREWANPDLSTDELVHQLTMAGLEVDAVEAAAGEFSGVVVAEVISAEKHPDADKLSLCQVNDGSGDHVQVICGASNVRKGLKVAFAQVGAVLPGDFNIKKAKLRGVESFGMLCSAKELGLAESSEGIIELPSDASVGTSVRDLLALDDVIIDVDLTPNRGDCLGIAGVAREVGALNAIPVTTPQLKKVTANHDQVVDVTLTASKECPHYCARVIQQADLSAPTPLWLQERLRRSGIRSINPVVDVTNYVMLELGQPMHGFDLDNIDGAIDVRLSAEAEMITLLDAQEVKLSAGTLLITDNSKTLAMAGVMGALNSGVTDATKNILLESAYFEPIAIAGKARSYGLHTDSSHRFERGVDPELQRQAIERATQLLLEITGGQVGPVVEKTAADFSTQKAPILLRLSRITRLLGITMTEDQAAGILSRLGMTVVRKDGDLLVTAPSFRFDIDIEADLIEELGRVYGYDNIPKTSLHSGADIGKTSESITPIGNIQSLLVGRGYQEAVTYAFVEPQLQAKILPNQEFLALANPISSEMSVMRASLWPGLIQTYQYNSNRQQNRVRIFETGLCFLSNGADLQQVPRIAGLISGDSNPEQWSEKARSVDFYDIKGDVEGLLGLSGLDDFEFKKTNLSALHPGQAAEILHKGERVGFVGAINPTLAKSLNLTHEVYLFECDLQKIQYSQLPKFQQLSRYPAIRRDLALEVDENIAVAEIKACIQSAEPDLLKEVIIFDIYQGKGMSSGLKSVALGLILQDISRTLTDSEVDEAVSRVLDKIKEELGVSLRE